MPKQQLKGAAFVVFNQLKYMIENHLPPSIYALSERTGYDKTTVVRALRQLRELGYISMRQPGPGLRAIYSINTEAIR